MYEISHSSKLSSTGSRYSADNQQSHLSSRSNRSRPISEYLDDVDFPLSRGHRHNIAPDQPPPRTNTRELRHQLRPRTTHHDDILTPSVDVPRPRERASAVAQYLAEARRRDPSSLRLAPIRPRAPYTVHEQQTLLPHAGPSSAGASRPHSPSRIRRLGLDPSAHSFIPRGPAPPSPPSAASRAWLDDYAPGDSEAHEASDSEARENARVAQAAFDRRLQSFPRAISRVPGPAPYIPGTILNAPFNRPGRRAREDDSYDDQEEQERAARYTQYAARHWEMAGAAAERNEEARAMRTHESELEALFGQWDGGSDSDDASTYPRLFEPVTDRPQPIPDAYGSLATATRAASRFEEEAAWLREQNRALNDESGMGRDTRRDGLVFDIVEPVPASALIEQRILAHEAAMADLEVGTLSSGANAEYEGPEGGPGEWASNVDWRL